MLESSECPCLTQQKSSMRLFDASVEDLHGHTPIQIWIVGPVDGAVRSAPEDLAQLEAPDPKRVRAPEHLLADLLEEQTGVKPRRLCLAVSTARSRHVRRLAGRR